MIMFGSLFNDWEGLRMECLQQAGHARKAWVQIHMYKQINGVKNVVLKQFVVL